MRCGYGVEVQGSKFGGMAASCACSRWGRPCACLGGARRALEMRNPAGAGSCWRLAALRGSRGVRERGGHGAKLTMASPPPRLQCRPWRRACASAVPWRSSLSLTHFFGSFERGEVSEARGIEWRQQFDGLSSDSIDLILDLGKNTGWPPGARQWPHPNQILNFSKLLSYFASYIFIRICGAICIFV